MMRGQNGAVLLLIAGLFISGALCFGADAAPFGAAGLQHRQNIAPQQISDSCEWWGTRWQYGSRGYGFYPCWEQAKPLPTVIDPQETPLEAVQAAPVEIPQKCIKRWRDSDGNLHARRVC
jgi:hypothetical protein